MNQVEITFRRMAPTEELIDAVRRTCQLVGSTLSDRLNWHILVHDERPEGYRVQLHVAVPGWQLVTTAVDDADPVIALQGAFASLLRHPDLPSAERTVEQCTTERAYGQRHSPRPMVQSPQNDAA